MNAEIGYTAAFLMGLLGSTHCAGMCGGLACALALNSPASVKRSALSMAAFQLVYNAGRIASYTLAGAICAYAAGRFALVFPVRTAQILGAGLMSTFLVGLGLYLGNWWRGFAMFERIGARAWGVLAPLARRLLPVRGVAHAAAFGLVWGWLPCGLVYGALAWAALSGDAIEGAARMAAFGLGTLPMLLVIGSAGQWLGNAARHPALRRALGVTMILAGVATLAGAGYLHGHETLVLAGT